MRKFSCLCYQPSLAAGPCGSSSLLCDALQRTAVGWGLTAANEVIRFVQSSHLWHYSLQVLPNIHWHSGIYIQLCWREPAIDGEFRAFSFSVHWVWRYFFSSLVTCLGVCVLGAFVFGVFFFGGGGCSSKEKNVSADVGVNMWKELVLKQPCRLTD